MSRMPARNKRYVPMPGHPEYVPGTVEELAEHVRKSREPSKAKKRRKKKSADEATT